MYASALLATALPFQCSQVNVAGAALVAGRREGNLVELVLLGDRGLGSRGVW